MDKIRIQDDSSDRKYFTIIPNYIANHSSANDQALYFQIKKHAGDDGECYVSQKTLMEKLDIGDKALKKSFTYLLENNWIKFIGLKDVMTSGGMQKIKSYKVVDIWKMNVNHYESKGVVESTPLTPKGVLKGGQRGSLSADKEEPLLKKKEISKEIIKEEPNSQVESIKEQIRKQMKIIK